MHNFAKLFKGEMQRLVKYKILQISFVVTVLWLGVIYMIGGEQAATFVPLFIFMDASLMSVLLVGASLFFEKQENTLKTLLITPSSIMAIIMSKVISSTYLAMQSTVIISLFAYFLFNTRILFIWLYVFVILIALAHTILGFVFAIYAQDFNGLLAWMIFYMFIFAFPSIFYMFGIFPDIFEMVLLFSPTHASLMMIDFAFEKDTALWMVIFGSVYLIIMSGLLFKFIVRPKYIEAAVRE